VKDKRAVPQRSFVDALLSLIGSFVLAFLSAGLGPCADRPLGSIKAPDASDAGDASDGSNHDTEVSSTCIYAGKVVHLGETFPSTDGCNKCSCTPNGVVCTDDSCESCVYVGKAFKPGETFTDPSNGCDICMCGTNGQVACKPGSNCSSATGGAGGGSSDAGAATICRFGLDQLCNDDLSTSTYFGKCLADGTCSCIYTLNPKTGRCLPPSSPTGCVYQGVSYTVGAKFPCADGCHTCYCVSDGKVDDQSGTCPTNDAGTSCTLDAVYIFTDTAANGSVQDEITMAASVTSSSYTLRRTRISDGGLITNTCSPGWTKCHHPEEIDVSDIATDLQLPDVLKAITVGTAGGGGLYGLTGTRARGPTATITRGDGQSFSVGDPCAGATNCQEIPPAMDMFVRDLRALAAQQLATDACRALTTP
jgi:hypothetical protein